MITFQSISVRNFKSFGNTPTEFALDEGLSTLIVGRNHDVGKEGESGNAAGKTTAQDAIVFALYGKGIDSKMKADEFVNLRNAKNMEVILKFEKAGTNYTIVRGRKPSKVLFFVGDEDITRDSMKNTDEEIQKVIGVPYEIFMRTIFMSPHIESFMGMSAAEQRNFIESLLSLDTLAERADVLKNVVRKDLQDELKLIERDIQNAEHSNEKMHEAIEKTQDSERNFAAKKQEKFDQLNAQIEAIVLPDEAGMKRLAEIENYSAQMETCTVNIEQYNASLGEHQESLKELNRLLTQLKELKKKRDSFGAESEEKKAAIESKLALYAPKEDYESVIHVNAKLTQTRNEIKEKERKLQGFHDDIAEMSRLIDDKTSQAESLSEGKCPYCAQSHYDGEAVTVLMDAIEELIDQQEKREVEATRLESELSDLKQEMQISEDHINKLQRDDATFERPETSIKTIESLELSLESISVKNPYVKDVKEFIADVGGDEEDLLEAIEVTTEEATAVEREIGRNETLRNDFKQIIEKLSAEIGFASVEEAQEAEKRVQEIQERLSEAQHEENPYTEVIEQYKGNLIELGPIIEQQQELEKSLTHVKYLIKLLTDPKSFVRKNIVDRFIPYVNKRINEYADKLGLMHVSEINADMSVSLEYMGQPVSYFMMSRGERLRINVATSLAFRELMALLGNNTNLLMVDELLDGSADTYGMNAIFTILKEAANDVFIISHREEFKDSVSRMMVVSKRNGYSDVEFD